MGQLTKALANEWAGKGINVNAIAPGYIAPTTRRRCRTIRCARPSWSGSRPGAGASPEDIKGAVVFLCLRCLGLCPRPPAGDRWRVDGALRWEHLPANCVRIDASGRGAAWLARLLGVQEVPSSNLGGPTSLQ